jgi:CheY-like chemotaxis protein
MYEQLRVLVADDDALMLDLIATWLEHEGADVVRAGTGSDLLLSLAEQGPFDLVITDIGMPWIDGLEAMRSVRYAGVSPAVIFITGSDDRELDRRVADLGSATALLRKPFQLDDLRSLVDRLRQVRPSR